MLHEIGKGINHYLRFLGSVCTIEIDEWFVIDETMQNRKIFANCSYIESHDQYLFFVRLVARFFELFCNFHTT